MATTISTHLALDQSQRTEQSPTATHRRWQITPPAHLFADASNSASSSAAVDDESTHAASSCASASAAAPWSLDGTLDQAWKISTEVKQSAIPAAGCGRFAQQTVKKGQIILENLIVSAKPSHGQCSLSGNAEEMQLRLDFSDVPGQPTNAEQLVHFGFTPANNSSRSCVYHLNRSFYGNHGDSNSSNLVWLETVKPDGSRWLQTVATKDIDAGAELLFDYRRFQLPAWFEAYSKSLDLESTETVGNKISPRLFYGNIPSFR